MRWVGIGAAILVALAVIGAVAGSGDDTGGDSNDVNAAPVAKVTMADAVRAAQRGLSRPLPEDRMEAIVRGICNDAPDPAAAVAASLAITIDLDELIDAARQGADTFCPAAKDENVVVAQQILSTARTQAGITADAESTTVPTTAPPTAAAPATTQAPATTSAPAPTQPPQQSNPGETVSQRNARRKAADYLDYTSFSRTGLIKQLEYEGFSHGDAVYGTDAQGADWNAQAAKKAAEYLDYTSFSRSGLIDQLVYEGFSRSEAEYGVSAVGL